MTSSFSSMTLMGSGLAFFSNSPKFNKLTNNICNRAIRIMSVERAILLHLTKLPFQRACHLGSNTLYRTMQKCCLKMHNMTAGQVVSISNSFMGIRHGPLVFINERCLDVAALSSDRVVKKYELDLLRQLRNKKQECVVLTIYERADAISRTVLDLH